MIASISKYLSDNFSSIVQAGLIFIFTIIIAKIVSFIVTGNMKIASKKLGKKFTIKNVTKLKLIRRLLVVIIYFIGLSAVLYQFEAFRRLGTLMFASASILGIIVGIASQASLSNIIAGIMISFTQPVRLGDFIEIDGKEGWVEEITLIYARIRTWDNKRLIIPNKQFFDSKIINHSIIDQTSLVKVDFTIDNSIDWEEYKKLIIDEIKKIKLCLLKKEPQIQIIEISKDQIKVEVTAWVENPQLAWNFSCEIREHLLKLLQMKKN